MMEKMIDALKEVGKNMTNKNVKIANEINNMVHEYNNTSPMIEQYAKPAIKEITVNDSGVIHSFSVEIKSNQDGPIPDTQLMSKILQSIESHNGSGENIGEMSTGLKPSFEVVSFKYERRDDSKKK